MKKMSLSLTVLIAVTMSIAQNVSNTYVTIGSSQHHFSLTELESYTSYSQHNFDDAVINRGYHYSNEISTSTLAQYISDNNNAQINKLGTSINYATTDKSYYLDLKSKLASYGYNYDKQATRTVGGKNQLWTYYTSNSHSLILYSFTVSGLTYYSIIIS